ncbi:hypothetical protein AAHE18_17G135700 [Arachis hypogaea]|uniref:EF-hand domain-containing protein n=1 Tax=Arachis hypogaea TaxID=3818 RepID=A0A444Y972_ARAHY|nr:hypothetical protein Ahy_B07g086240 isoform B [Arachis hypogaea]
MLFDTNNDGVISFPEYIFFVTLLSVPESSFTVAFKMFDLNNNGQLIETKEAIERQRKLFKKKKTEIEEEMRSNTTIMLLERLVECAADG